MWTKEQQLVAKTFIADWRDYPNDPLGVQKRVCGRAGFHTSATDYFWCGKGAAGWLAVAGLRKELWNDLLHTGNVLYCLSNGKEGIRNAHRYDGPMSGRHLASGAELRNGGGQFLDVIVFKWRGSKNPTGDHIALLGEVAGDHLYTIEANGRAYLGNGKIGNGIVIRRTSLRNPAVYRWGRFSAQDFGRLPADAAVG